MLISVLFVALLSCSFAQNSTTSSSLTQAFTTATTEVEIKVADGQSRPVPFANYEAQPAQDSNVRVLTSPNRSSRRLPNVEYTSYDSRTNEPSSRFNNPRAAPRPSTRSSRQPTDDRQPVQGGEPSPNQPIDNDDFRYRTRTTSTQDRRIPAGRHPIPDVQGGEPSPNQPIDNDDFRYRTRTTSTQDRRIPASRNPIPDDISFKPYSFNYVSDAEDGYYTHQQSSDDSGRVVGSYSFVLDDGRKRVVEYIADQNGFRANIDSNEPGMNLEETPADVVYYSGTNPGRRADSTRPQQPGYHAPSLTVYNRFGADSGDGNQVVSERQPVGGIRRPIYNAPGGDLRIRDSGRPSSQDSDVMTSSGRLNISEPVPLNRGDTRIPTYGVNIPEVTSSEGLQRTRGVPEVRSNRASPHHPGPAESSFFGARRFDAELPNEPNFRNPAVRVTIPSRGLDEEQRNVVDRRIPQSQPTENGAPRHASTIPFERRPAVGLPSYFRNVESRTNADDPSSPENPRGNYNYRVFGEERQGLNVAGRRLPVPRPADDDSSRRTVPEPLPDQGIRYIPRDIRGEDSGGSLSSDVTGSRDARNNAPTFNARESVPSSPGNPRMNYNPNVFGDQDRQDLPLISPIPQNRDLNGPLIEYHPLHEDGDQPYYYSFDNGNYWFHRH